MNLTDLGSVDEVFEQLCDGIDCVKWNHSECSDLKPMARRLSDGLNSAGASKQKRTWCNTTTTVAVYDLTLEARR